ncbi:MAG: D-alanine--D-alanine ligase family protein [Candidatus Omnitrophota bacterium]
MSEWSGRKIAVLAGGPSHEREISLLSGRAVFDALTSKGLSLFMLDPEGDVVEKLKKENVEMAFLALHGTFGEDGTIQRMLDEAGIPYTGPGARVSEIAFDKARTQTLFQKAGIRVPAFQILQKGEEAALRAPWEFPFVVKPSRAGSSVGISIVSDARDYEKACEEAFHYDDTVLVEQYIPGRELTVGFLGNEALPVVEVIAQRKFYDYEAKYNDPGTRYEFPARLSPREEKAVVEAASDAYRALGCEVMGRVDVILGGDGMPTVLEVNTIPGLTAKSLLPKAARASGINFPDLCVKIIEVSWRKAEAWSNR